MKEEQLEKMMWAATFAAAVIAAIGIVAIFFGSIWFVSETKDFAKFGVYGDFFSGTFGTVVAVVTGLMVAAAFLAQQHQLRQQQKEIEATNDRLEEDRENASLERFEKVFFEMLALHHRIVDSITVMDDEKRTHSGRAAFRVMSEKLKYRLSYNAKRDEYLREDVMEIFEVFYREFLEHLGHYIRNLYYIMRYIDSSKTLKDKVFYAHMLRGQLSTFEVTLLVYYGLSPDGVTHFKPLVEKYRMFTKLEKRHLQSTAILSGYSLQTYQRTEAEQKALLEKQESAKQRAEASAENPK